MKASRGNTHLQRRSWIAIGTFHDHVKTTTDEPTKPHPTLSSIALPPTLQNQRTLLTRSWARTSRYNGRTPNRVSARIEVGHESIIGTKQLGVKFRPSWTRRPLRFFGMQKDFSEGAILAYEQGHIMISYAQDGNNTWDSSPYGVDAGV